MPTAHCLLTRYDVAVFDVVFLNQRRIPAITASAVLKKGTKLLVPRYQDPSEVEAEAASFRPAWHVVGEDATLKREATKCGVEASTLVALNKATLRGLQLNSYLLKGTRLLTSGTEIDFAECACRAAPSTSPRQTATGPTPRTTPRLTLAPTLTPTLTPTLAPTPTLTLSLTLSLPLKAHDVIFAELSWTPSAMEQVRGTPCT